MQSTSIHVLFEKLTNLGVTLSVEDGKLEWETILPLPGSLLNELIARQAEFVGMINGVPIDDNPVCLMPRPLLGGDRISSDEVAGIIALLEEFGKPCNYQSGEFIRPVLNPYLQKLLSCCINTWMIFTNICG